MTENTLIKQTKAPILRKVFKQGKSYICGICRTKHPRRNEANDCLNHCWYALREQYPLILKQDHHQTYYRCQFCFRDYADEQDGLECANRCMDEREHNHIQEQLVNHLPITVKPRQKFRLVKLAMPVQGTNSPTKNNDDSSDEMDIASIADDASEQLEEAEPEIQKRHRSEFKKEWVRADAKYKCMFCFELYYTKVEVIKCFGDHFDAEGYEILGDAPKPEAEAEE